jgi:hypothetical protein
MDDESLKTDLTPDVKRGYLVDSPRRMREYDHALSCKDPACELDHERMLREAEDYARQKQIQKSRYGANVRPHGASSGPSDPTRLPPPDRNDSDKTVAGSRNAEQESGLSSPFEARLRDFLKTIAQTREESRSATQELLEALTESTNARIDAGLNRVTTLVQQYSGMLRRLRNMEASLDATSLPGPPLARRGRRPKRMPTGRAQEIRRQASAILQVRPNSSMSLDELLKALKSRGLTASDEPKVYGLLYRSPDFFEMDEGTVRIKSPFL